MDGGSKMTCKKGSGVSQRMSHMSTEEKAHNDSTSLSADLVDPENNKYLASQRTRKRSESSSRTRHSCDYTVGKSVPNGSTSDNSLKNYPSFTAKLSIADIEGDSPQLKEIVVLVPKSAEADQLKLFLNMDSSVDEGCIIYSATICSTNYYVWESFSRETKLNDEYMLQLRLFLEKRHSCYIFFVLPRRSRNGNPLDCLNRVKKMFVDSMKNKICVIITEEEHAWKDQFLVDRSSGRISGNGKISNEEAMELFPLDKDKFFDRVTGFKNNACTIC